jgi:hypothetical protein
VRSTGVVGDSEDSAFFGVIIFAQPNLFLQSPVLLKYLKMFRVSPMKYVVLVSMLTAMGVMAADPDYYMDQARELDSGHRHGQVRELLHSAARLPGEGCVKTSPTLDSANDKLTDQASAVECTAFPCTTNYNSLPAYSSYRSACSAAKGALAT